jgi:spore maturation protein SpmB
MQHWSRKKGMMVSKLLILRVFRITGFLDFVDHLIFQYQNLDHFAPVGEGEELI